MEGSADVCVAGEGEDKDDIGWRKGVGYLIETESSAAFRSNCTYKPYWAVNEDSRDEGKENVVRREKYKNMVDVKWTNA